MKMSVNCRGEWAWGTAMVCFIFIIPLFTIRLLTADSAALASEAKSFGNSETNLINHKHARRKLDDVAGSINIDCGIPDDFSYIDDQTHLEYASDRKFISTGLIMNISTNFNSETLQRSLVNVRSFPQGKRNCYTLRPPEGRDTRYLIRASFMYGNYDGQDSLPEFDLYVGVNSWDSVKFDNASQIVIKEIIHMPLTDSIYVCLLNTGLGTPFISALELRHFHNASYSTESGSLVLYKRLDVGSTTNQIVRYKDDSYDRMWYPYEFPDSVSISTALNIDTMNETAYKMPSRVMQTAVGPMNVNDSLDLDFDIGNPILEFYVYMHFAELERLEANQYREFNITINGNLWSNSVIPDYLSSTTIYRPVRGSKLSFSLYKSGNSNLPPILNAMEIYIVKDFLHAPTDQEDVNAIMGIMQSYGVGKDWQGDPCAPEYFSWDVLKCIYSGYDPPKITSLNLTSMGLTGRISHSLSKLKSLQELDLSNNSLTGALPDFLSELPDLRLLNLNWNKLSGSVPSALMARSKNGPLSLWVEGNPELCLLAPCKREKNNIVVPLVAAIVSSLVVLIALVVLWAYKRKRGTWFAAKSYHSYDKEGSLKSNNRQFTYSEIVSMTNNFRKVIGKGGFGTVYHGYLDDETQIAVKILSNSSAQGSQQFRTEAQLLMRVHHRNLASLVGYCNEGSNTGIVYEYMAYGNLEQYLLDKTKDALSWKERLQIAVDAAQGLEYLHHGCRPPIIHRDVKTANILLNEKFQAKIADFGFSKDFPIESESHLTTAVVGTVGYLDPEYYLSNRLTEKSDVYSFGVVLLELITGLPAIIRSHENTHIVQWVSRFLERGDIRSIVDSRLEGNFDTNSVWKAMETAMACVPSISIQRPTMSHVVIELKECLELEVAREQSGRMENQIMRPNNSLEMSCEDLDMEMGPQAR